MHHRPSHLVRNRVGISEVAQRTDADSRPELISDDGLRRLIDCAVAIKAQSSPGATRAGIVDCLGKIEGKLNHTHVSVASHPPEPCRSTGRACRTRFESGWLTQGTQVPRSSRAFAKRHRANRSGLHSGRQLHLALTAVGSGHGTRSSLLHLLDPNGKRGSLLWPQLLSLCERRALHAQQRHRRIPKTLHYQHKKSRTKQ